MGGCNYKDAECYDDMYTLDLEVLWSSKVNQ